MSPQTFGLQTPLSSFQVYQLLLFSMASLSHSVGISPPSLLLLCCLFFFFLQYIHFFLYCPRMSISASYGHTP